MSPPRFEHLEHDFLPSNIEKAIAQLPRFDHLEIGGISSLPPIPSPPTGKLCARCGQPNEPNRSFCWACFKPLTIAPPLPQEKYFTVVLNGATYRSDQPNLPPSVQRLMERVRREGYSQTVAARWAADEGGELKKAAEFKTSAPDNSNVSIVRVDDRVYRSDDTSLPPEMRTLLEYVRTNAITPELMGRLRQAGEKVKYRPANTLSPSDGDLSFWTAVQGPPHNPPLNQETTQSNRVARTSLTKWIPHAIGGLICLYLLKNGPKVLALFRRFLP